jgi:hypothetical protein
VIGVMLWEGWPDAAILHELFSVAVARILYLLALRTPTEVQAGTQFGSHSSRVSNLDAAMLSSVEIAWWQKRRNFVRRRLLHFVFLAGSSGSK